MGGSIPSECCNDAVDGIDVASFYHGVVSNCGLLAIPYLVLQHILTPLSVIAVIFRTFVSLLPFILVLSSAFFCFNPLP